MMNDRLERVQIGRDYDVPILEVWYICLSKMMELGMLIHQPQTSLQK